MNNCLLFENGRLSYPEERPRPDVMTVERKLLRRSLYRVGEYVDLYAFKDEEPSDWLRQYARTRMTGRVPIHFDVFVTEGEDVAQIDRLAKQLLHYILYTEVKRERVLSRRERRRRARWAGRRHSARVPKRVVESVRCLDLPAIETHLRGLRSAKVELFVKSLVEAPTRESGSVSRRG